MSDFDVVRRELATDIHSDPDEAIAALDRIEAKWKQFEDAYVSKVVAASQVAPGEWESITAENERLRSAAAEAFDFLMRLPIETAQVWRVGALADRLRSALDDLGGAE